MGPSHIKEVHTWSVRQKGPSLYHRDTIGNPLQSIPLQFYCLVLTCLILGGERIRNMAVAAQLESLLWRNTWSVWHASTTLPPGQSYNIEHPLSLHSYSHSNPVIKHSTSLKKSSNLKQAANLAHASCLIVLLSLLVFVLLLIEIPRCP